MFSMNSKQMERNRLMFKRKRLSQKSQSKKQYFGSEEVSHWTEREAATQWSQWTQWNESEDILSDTSICFEDIISFGNFEFVYDKEFLNNLKQLTKELKISFATPESRSKSRGIQQSIVHNVDIDDEKTELINKINDKIKVIEDAIKATEDTTELCSQNFSQNNQHLTQNECSQSQDNRCTQSSPESDYDSDGDNPLMAKPYEYDMTRESPFFVQQYLQSLHSNQEFRFSQQNYRILSSSQVMASDDSGFGSYSNNGSDCDQPMASHMSPQPFSQSASQTVESRDRLQIVNRHKWTNTDYDISTGITLKVVPQNKVRTQRKRKNQLKFVLEKILGLIENDVFCTKRDLYYQNVEMFDKSQRVVDEIIDDLACSLRVSRTKLHIVSSTRGLVFGHLRFQNTNGHSTDCLSSPNGINIPNDTERITRMQSKARFVLIIEKDATFQQLIDLRIHNKFPIIMVTGHGYPDMNTRAFIQMLWNTFEIPIFGLVDGDAHGLEILCTFRHGSLALSYESHNLVAPVIKWLGILPTDIIDYNLSPSVQIPLSERDKKKIEDLKNRIYLIGNQEWTKQLNILLKLGKKVEIQSLAEHWPSFLLDVYLPGKIRYGKWI